MTNTYIEPGNMSFEELIADIKLGVYARNWFGGTTSMEMSRLGRRGVHDPHGKVAELLRPVKLTGNLFTTLMKHRRAGQRHGPSGRRRRAARLNQGGGCGKAGQMPLPVLIGSPHIRIQDVLSGEVMIGSLTRQLDMAKERRNPPPSGGALLSHSPNAAAAAEAEVDGFARARR